MKDMFHASADEKRSRLVSVVGVAGIGKSRLSWEFEKYIDGLAADVWWHRGRCLSYGDGVAYWALAEMVRGRAKILEDEDAEGSRGEAARRARGQRRRRGGARLDRASAAPAARPQRPDLARPRGSLLGLAALLRAARRARAARDGVRGHPLGRRGPRRVRRVPARLGPPPSDLRRSRWRAPRSQIAIPRFPGSMRSSTTLPLEPLDDAAMDELLLGLVPGSPTTSEAGCARRPTASRSTPSRRCGCCATAACSSRPEAATSSPATSRRSRCRERCRR